MANEIVEVKKVEVVTPEVVNPESGGNQAAAAAGPGYLGNLSYEEREQAMKVLAHKAGIRVPSTRVPAGESLLPIGEANKRKLAEEFDKLPGVAEGLLAARFMREQEKPIDIEVPIQEVRMLPSNGGIFGNSRRPDDDSRALGYTHTAFSDICNFFKPASIRGGFNQTLEVLPPKIRADAFNYFTENAVRPGTKPVKLRTHIRSQQQPAGADGVAAVTERRLVRAAVSDIYGIADDVDAFAILQDALPAGGKLRYTRGEDITEIEIIFPMLAREIKVGDLSYGSLRVRNSETKRSGLRVQGQIFRTACYNFTQVPMETTDEDVQFDLRHLGDAKRKLGDAVRSALNMLDPFVRAFGDAYRTPMTRTRGETIGSFLKWAKLPARLGEGIARVWDADPEPLRAGDTLAGLANAITRSAQELEIGEAIELERAAGRVVTQGWDAIM